MLNPMTKVVPRELFEFGADGRRSRLMVFVMCVVCMLWVTNFILMSTVGFSGDEAFYYHSSSVISDYLRGRIGLPQAVFSVVHNGWFMPGISILALPVHVLVETPPVWLVRLYMLAINTLLWIAAVRVATRAFGVWPGRILFVFPIIHMTWQQFSATIWADAPAGLWLVVAAGYLTKIVSGMVNGSPLRLLQILKLAALMAVLVYLRGNLILFAVATFLALTVVGVTYGRGIERIHSVFLAVVGLVFFFATLLPWSATVSALYGGPVITTTSPALGLAYTFGDADKLCFGPCPGNEIWSDMFSAIKQHAEANDTTVIQAQNEMTRAALSGVTFNSYFADVRRNFGTFVFAPTKFNQRFVEFQSYPALRPVMERLIGMTSPVFQFVYYAVLAGMAASCVSVFRNRASAIGGIIIRIAVMCLFLQPFVHIAHERYWPTFAPMAALAAGLFVAQIAAYVSKSPVLGEPAFPADGLMIWTQAAMSCLFVAVAALTVLG